MKIKFKKVKVKDEEIRKLKRENKVLFILFVFFEILFLTTILPLHNNITRTDNPITINKLEIDYDCSNKSLIDTSYCLNDYVNEIYLYNLTDDNIELTLEDLKTRGGDCKDWSEFYERNLNYYGYNTTRTIIPINKKYKHMYISASDETGYCSLDLTDVNCFVLDNKFLKDSKIKY